MNTDKYGCEWVLIDKDGHKWVRDIPGWYYPEIRARREDFDENYLMPLADLAKLHGPLTTIDGSPL